MKKMAREVEIVTLYHAIEPNDKTEGRGGSVSRGYFLNKDLPLRLYPDVGVQGRPIDIDEVTALRVLLEGGVTEYYLLAGTRTVPVQTNEAEAHADRLLQGLDPVTRDALRRKLGAP